MPCANVIEPFAEDRCQVLLLLALLVLSRFLLRVTAGGMKCGVLEEEERREALGEGGGGIDLVSSERMSSGQSNSACEIS